MQVARRRASGPRVVDIEGELAFRRHRPAKCLEKADQQPPVGAPHALRTQFDDAVDFVKGAEQLELVIKRQNRRTKTHSNPPRYASFGQACGDRWIVPRNRHAARRELYTKRAAGIDQNRAALDPQGWSRNSRPRLDIARHKAYWLVLRLRSSWYVAAPSETNFGSKGHCEPDAAFDLKFLNELAPSTGGTSN